MVCVLCGGGGEGDSWGDVKTNKGWVRVPYGGVNVNTVGALIREFTPVWEDFSRRQMRRLEGVDGRPRWLFVRTENSASRSAKKKRRQRRRRRWILLLTCYEL